MSLVARGTVYLDGLRFTTDPAVYEPLNWPKRFSVHEGLEGSVTIQDFGVTMKDNVVRLQSGDRQYMEQSLAEALHTRFRTKGVTYTLTDWVGNQLTVFILSFTPKPTFIGTLWTYSMELRVLGITKLFGATYTGS